MGSEGVLEEMNEFPTAFSPFVLLIPDAGP